MRQGEQPPRPQLTQGEFYRGWVFFGLYALIFPFLVFVVRSVLSSTLELDFTDAAANGVYYYICTALVFLLFWSFLKKAFNILLDHWQENLFAVGIGLAGFVILNLLVRVLPLPVESPDVYNIPGQFAIAPATTIVILVLLQPIIEEVLFRGLLFGGVRKKSRALAWTLSVLLFCLFKVWTFAFLPTQLDFRYLLLAVQYLPLSLAATLCYDIGGSVWSSVGVHMLISGAMLWMML